MSSDLALVLVSGGMDSLVCLALAHEQFSKVAMLHLDYGQKTASKETLCFKLMADHYAVEKSKRKIINMDFLKSIGGSSLTDEKIAVSTELAKNPPIPTSYVPFRNSIILSLATSWAEVIKAKHIFIGANEEDSPGYPDCRQSYYQIFQELIKQGSADGNIQLHTPIITFRKEQIVNLGQRLDAPFEKSWSCYQSVDKACGRCDSCQLRLKGFKKAGIKDPIAYQTSL